MNWTELFKHPVVQSDILNGKFEKIYPITKLEDFGPIEFLIQNATDSSGLETKLPEH